ncbi:hypothetical protein HOK51_07855 [Candidatus Woesearchaeota archaeon]|nr:hypothetical protein [Candidatus Woesearchaeota archaeon]MBT6519739.1 hypothetical protein [Candidatus Woesearchaeota archaeon]MBT7368119.1 hypothetical protein [Candidatus Woesearchaeota archaeon]
MSQTNLALKKLKGIKPKGVKPKLQSRLEYLHDVRDELFEHLHSIRDNHPSGFNFLRFTEIESVNNLFTDRMNNFNLDKSLLTDFVHANTGDYDADYSSFLGSLSTELLDFWCKKQKSDNKDSIFYINGGGNKFEKLFCKANTVDALIIDNFTGNYIGHSAGMKKNSVVEMLIGLNLRGDTIFSDLAIYSGQIGLVALLNSESNMSLNDIASNSGVVGVCIANNIKGCNNLNSLATSNGNMKLLHVDNLEGSESLYDLNFPYAHVEISVVGDIDIPHSYDLIDDVFRCTIPFTKELFEKKQDKENYNQAVKKYNLQEMTDLIEELSGASDKKIIKNITRLQELYKKTKTELEKETEPDFIYNLDI